MRLLVDREQLIGQALSGQGRVANDLYAPFGAAYASDLAQPEPDVEQAKTAGVTVKVRKVDSGTFYDTGKYLQWPFAQDVWFTRTYLAQVAQGSLKSSPFNEMHWNHPEFVKLIGEARA
jgi:peptide/nickel transport system substrate-binding protein